MIIHQSDITSYARCAQAMFLDRSGNPGITTSALAYGNVMHYAVERFEREYRTGTAWRQAVVIAVDTFKHYWHPMHIESICSPVELWLPRQSYGGMLRSGVEAIHWYAEWSQQSGGELLATEFAFKVPIEGTWDEDADEPHTLVGTIDRLAMVRHKGHPVVQIGDLKTGKDYPYLRQNLQFTAYAYASTRKEFWTGWRGEDGFGDEGQQLHINTQGIARQGLWISLKHHKPMDAGWRGPEDYARFAVAVEQVAASIKADIYPLSISGENCSYCSHRQICAGTGIPAADHGAPTLKVHRELIATERD